VAGELPACKALVEAAGLIAVYAVLEGLPAEQDGLEESLEVQDEPGGLLEVRAEAVQAVIPASMDLRQGLQVEVIYLL